MTTENTRTPVTSRWPLATFVLASLAVIVGTLIWFFSRPADNPPPVEAALPTTHPIFGAIHETRAMDVMEQPQIRGPTGGLLPRIPIYLALGPGFLEWSAANADAGKQSGYLYFWDPVSRLKGSYVWAFAPCPQSSLADLTEKDLQADFCGADDTAKGRAVYGTNWMEFARRGNSVLVRERQVILARNSDEPSRIYALEMTKQNRGNLRVRYLEVVR